jgi:NAD(P)-dependent dehydrogenase (short-subunit alcohol dehydrogenase family)
MSIPNFRLDGKRALITGAGRGIGAAAAEALAAFGAQVTLVSRTGSDIEDLAARINASGGKAFWKVGDVTDSRAMAALVDDGEAHDVLVNNAGMNRTDTFIDVKEEDFDAIYALNVRACFFAAQAFARRLVREARPGSIINMSSQMGHVGAATRSVYCGTKWAIEGMTKAIAVDLAPAGIRVNTICPTFVETPMANSFLKSDGFKAEVLSKIKLGRIGTVGDITGAVVFLASDASALMTGSSIIVDGGWTAD